MTPLRARPVCVCARAHACTLQSVLTLSLPHLSPRPLPCAGTWYRCGTGAAQQLAQGMSAAAADLDSQPSGAAAAASLIAHR